MVLLQDAAARRCAPTLAGGIAPTLNTSPHDQTTRIPRLLCCRTSTACNSTDTVLSCSLPRVKRTADVVPLPLRGCQTGQSAALHVLFGTHVGRHREGRLLVRLLGRAFSSGACPPDFVPGKLHFKNKFSEICRACLPVPLTHVPACAQPGELARGRHEPSDRRGGASRVGSLITGSGAEPQKKILPLKRFLGLKTRTQRT